MRVIITETQLKLIKEDYKTSQNEIDLKGDKYGGDVALRKLSYRSKWDFNSKHRGITIKDDEIALAKLYNEENEEINEGSHSTKELSKLIDWTMKKMDCYVTRTTKGMKLCPPEYIKEPCYVAHFSDKAVHPLMSTISKWFGSTKYNVERAFGENKPL